MASKLLNSKCIKCSKGFLNIKRKTVQCTLRSNHLHLKFTDLDKNTYQSFNEILMILFASIAHTTQALLVRSMRMINKDEIFVMAVISGLIDGVLG